ncbi:MAG: hypothetical protein IPO64_11925 [Bacteroidetes bacterium]|nr:hypothetical protein [Bacteroidota bacterium]
MDTNALDEAIALPTDFSSKNSQKYRFIDTEETGITKVAAGPLGGIYYINSLTTR